MSPAKAAASKEDIEKFKEEIIQRFHVISEDVISQVKQVAEGVVGVREELQKTRLDLKSEIQETRQEVLAAIKFSYAELDRRITALEQGFLELKQRVDKIEDRSLS